MDVARPYTAVCPSLDGEVLRVLSGTASALTGREVARLTGRSSHSGVLSVLNRLTEHGLVTRIESQNAYILCRHPNEEHDCLFFICRTCGMTTEAPDDGIRNLLLKEASSLGFGIDKQILEVVGLCKNCARKSA